MYRPQHWHFFGPAFFIVVGLFIWEQIRPQDGIVLLAVLLFYFTSGCWSYYIMQAGIIYQNYLAAADAPASRPEVSLKPTLPDLNMQYQQTTASIKLDPSRSFLKFILLQHDEGFDDQIDLREPYWLEYRHSPSGKRRFRHWQGRNSAEFRQMKRDYQDQGIFGRTSENKNADFYVRDWDAVRKIVYG